MDSLRCNRPSHRQVQLQGGKGIQHLQMQAVPRTEYLSVKDSHQIDVGLVLQGGTVLAGIMHSLLNLVVLQDPAQAVKDALQLIMWRGYEVEDEATVWGSYLHP